MAEIVTESGRVRAERSDAGQVRVTERDLLLVGWLADMKAVYETDLAVLIGRLTGRQPGYESVRSLLRRWQRAQIADARKLIASRPRIVRLRSNGAHLVGQDRFKETAEFTAYHQADVARMRLLLEGAGDVAGQGRVVAWESERQFRQSVGELFKGSGRSIHVPDGVATLENGKRAAVEVERSLKTPVRLQRILTELNSYDLVIYACSDQVIRDAVAAAHAAVQRRAKQEGRAKVADLMRISIPEEVMA